MPTRLLSQGQNGNRRPEQQNRYSKEIARSSEPAVNAVQDQIYDPGHYPADRNEKLDPKQSATPIDGLFVVFRAARVAQNAKVLHVGCPLWQGRIARGATSASGAWGRGGILRLPSPATRLIFSRPPSRCIHPDYKLAGNFRAGPFLPPSGPPDRHSRARAHE